MKSPTLCMRKANSTNNQICTENFALNKFKKILMITHNVSVVHVRLSVGLQDQKTVDGYCYASVIMV